MCDIFDPFVSLRVNGDFGESSAAIVACISHYRVGGAVALGDRAVLLFAVGRFGMSAV